LFDLQCFHRLRVLERQFKRVAESRQRPIQNEVKLFPVSGGAHQRKHVSKVVFQLRVNTLTHLQLVKFFVSGGTTFQTEMPAGRFVLKIGSGINWCGRKEMFGPDTVTGCLAHKSDASGTCSIYTFGPNDTWEIDLVRQVGGNLSTSYVPRDKF
jgi:hypothetical protein